MSETSSDQPQAIFIDPIIAGPGKSYRSKRFLISAILVGMGLWFGYDGWSGWPKSNEIYLKLEQEKRTAQSRGDFKTVSRVTEEQRNYKLHSDTDILLQKIFCIALPPLGLFLAFLALRNSRGEYRLEGMTLYVPGHPPVPFANITEIDRKQWDRKGIAYLDYDLGDGRQGRIRVDDEFYDRIPTDEIFKRVDEYVNPPAKDAKTASEDDDEKEAHES